VSPQRFEVSRKSRDVDIAVVTQPACALRAETTAGWLEVSPRARTGTGNLRLKIDENRGASRTAAVTLTGEDFQTTVSVLQEEGKEEGKGDDDKR
jgi:hypothetical protein